MIKFCITSFLMVYFISVNVYCISQQNYTLAFISSFWVNYLWTVNVKRIAFGGSRDKIIYAVCTSIGCVLGILTGKYLRLWI